MKVKIFYCDNNVYPFGRAPFEWACCIYTLRNGEYTNRLFNSVTKPTARQIRRWKKRMKHSHE